MALAAKKPLFRVSRSLISLSAALSSCRSLALSPGRLAIIHPRGICFPGVNIKNRISTILVDCANPRRSEEALPVAAVLALGGARSQRRTAMLATVGHTTAQGLLAAKRLAPRDDHNRWRRFRRIRGES